MTRSFPEKTFEHWCSIHLGYRYKAQLQMWWPAKGEDIKVASLPTSPGKRIWLELKTTEWVRTSARHELKIDLLQLREYGKGSIPDYYVFPVPRWSGYLQSAGSWLAGLSASALAYQAQSGAMWFAEWTVVVPGAALRRALASEMAAGVKDKLVAHVTRGSLKWAPGLVGIPTFTWKGFWERIERCGSSTLGAQFLVPPNWITMGGAAGTGGPGAPNGPNAPVGSPVATSPTRRDLSGALSALKDEGAQAALGQVRAYAPGPGEGYQKVDLDVVTSGFDWRDPHRALVVLGLGALRFK